MAWRIINGKLQWVIDIGETKEKETETVKETDSNAKRNKVNKKAGEEVHEAVQQTVSEDKGEYEKMHGWKKIINELNGKNGAKLLAEKGTSGKNDAVKVEFSSLTEKHHISVPNKIDIFDGLDITERDRLYHQFPSFREK